MGDGGYVTAEEAARMLGVSTRTITRWLKEGRIPSARIGRSHRIPVAALQHDNGQARTWDGKIELPLTFFTNEISKNRMWRGGSRRAGLTPDAKAWRETIVDQVKLAFLAIGARALALPVEVEIRTTFPNERRALDPQNLVELIDDAIEEATGINDRNYKTVTWPPTYDPAALPTVTIQVTARCTA